MSTAPLTSEEIASLKALLVHGEKILPLKSCGASDGKCKCGISDLMFAIRAYDKAISDMAEALR